jgi:hypothetical protein
MRTGEDMAQPVQSTARRSAGVAVLAIPLLAVLVLAGVGAVASLRDGARAERVRGLVPFAGALTSLVHELQRERSLSVARAPARPTLEAARSAVDGAAFAYRDAAVRVEGSDRDPRLRQRLDTGLARLAELGGLRAKVDGPAGRGDGEADRVAVFHHYTAVIGNLLAVGGEVGLNEAGQDAGLLRAVTAATAFSRAKELADREREAAAQTAAGTATLDPSERTRLAALGGRQDALLDQFATLASPEQRAWYTRAFPETEGEEAARLRRAALEAGSAQATPSDLTAWSEASATRSERMREVELGLIGEVSRLATLADRSADRRLLAYAAIVFAAASAVLVLLILTPLRARRSAPSGEATLAGILPGSAFPGPGASKPRRSLPSPPEGERSPTAEGGPSVVHTPLSHTPSGHGPTPAAASPATPSRARPTRPTPVPPTPAPPIPTPTPGPASPPWPGGVRTWSTSSWSCSTRPGGTRPTRGFPGGCCSWTGSPSGRGATPTT